MIIIEITRPYHVNTIIPYHLILLYDSLPSSGSSKKAENDSLLRLCTSLHDRFQKDQPYANSGIETLLDILSIRKKKCCQRPGTKSVIFNATGSKLYAMNLEGMSVYEFDQSSRKLTREFKFTPQGNGLGL